jgi:hypothetical protein
MLLLFAIASRAVVIFDNADGVTAAAALLLAIRILDGGGKGSSAQAQLRNVAHPRVRPAAMATAALGFGRAMPAAGARQSLSANDAGGRGANELAATVVDLLAFLLLVVRYDGSGAEAGKRALGKMAFMVRIVLVAVRVSLFFADNDKVIVRAAVVTIIAVVAVVAMLVTHSGCEVVTASILIPARAVVASVIALVLIL